MLYSRFNQYPPTHTFISKSTKNPLNPLNFKSGTYLPTNSKSYNIPQILLLNIFLTLIKTMSIFQSFSKTKRPEPIPISLSNSKKSFSILIKTNSKFQKSFSFIKRPIIFHSKPISIFKSSFN